MGGGGDASILTPWPPPYPPSPLQFLPSVLCTFKKRSRTLSGHFNQYKEKQQLICSFHPQEQKMYSTSAYFLGKCFVETPLAVC